MAGTVLLSGDRAAVLAPASERDEPGRLLPSFTAGLILLGFAARLFYGYDADELQNLHYAWNIAHGLVPFRDFFEHHPPLLHYVLAPFVGGLSEPGFGLLLATR